MARNRTSPAEDLVIIASKFPWWVGLTLAFLSYLVLHTVASRPIMPHALAPGQFGDAVARGLLTTLAMFGQYVLPFLFGFGAIGSAIADARQKRLYNGVASRASLSAFNEISWAEFETLVAEHFRRAGFEVRRQGGHGPDGGIDLVLRHNSETYFVQCKQWKAYKVGVQPVRELYGVIAARGAAGGYVVTSGTYTDDAKEFVKGLNIELIDGEQLRRMMQDVRSGLAASKSIQNQPASPACPKCGSEMKKRVARQGSNAGKEFWGCVAFPRCRGVLPVETSLRNQPPSTVVQHVTRPQPEKKSCPNCGGDLVLREFQSGPKIGKQFYGCVPCKKGWPVEQ